MNKNMKKIIEQCIEFSTYIDIERNKIEESFIGGFPLQITDQFLVLSKIYDFRNDGVLILRTKDITNVYSVDENSLYEKICKDEGLDKVCNPFVKLDSLCDIILNKDIREHYITIQCEKSDNEQYFSIGLIISADNKNIIMKSFNINGEWENELRKIPLEEITLISVNDYYSKMFFKYMN